MEIDHSPLVTTPLLVFFVTVILHVAALRLFPRFGLLDFPQRYGLTRKRLPYPTGILAVIVFLCTLPFVRAIGMQEAGLMAGIILLGISSFIDDRYRLSPYVRLLVQILAAFLIFATGTRIYTLTNPLSTFMDSDLIKLDTIDIQTSFFGPLPLLSGMFTIVWLLLTINALNWFDGIPGQVNVISVLGFLTIGLLSLSSRVNQPELAILCFILCAIAAACLLFDFPPPRVVTGDSGAMFFGLMLGALTIYAGGKVATAFLVLGVPLIDSVIVVIRRLMAGTSPLKGSMSGEHLHHRLLARGWSPRSVIALTALLGSLFGITALFLNTFEKFVAALFLLLIMIGLSWATEKKN